MAIAFIFKANQYLITKHLNLQECNIFSKAPW